MVATITMPHEAKTTTDHNEIRAWVESRDGRPAKVKCVGEQEGEGILRIDFPGGAGEESLEPIPWEEFFDIFESRNLAFLYQEELASGEESRFFKFVRREE